MGEGDVLLDDEDTEKSVLSKKAKGRSLEEILDNPLGD